MDGPAKADIEVSVDNVLSRELENHPDLVRGRLENGLEYVILPNANPPSRFEAHLELHAGERLLPNLANTQQ